jgi:arylsulfatase A-like enzyme
VVTVVDPTLLRESRPLVRFPLAEDEERKRWTLSSVSVRPGRGAVVLAATSDDPYMVRDVDVAAGDVCEVVVEARGYVPATGQLFWAGPDGSFDEERSARPTARYDRGQTVLTFDVSASPAWAGRVARLRLDPVANWSAPVAVEGVALRACAPAAARTADVVGRPVVVEHDAELRTAFLLREGQTLERSLEVPAAGTLRFALAPVPITGVNQPAPGLRVWLVRTLRKPSLLYEAPATAAQGWRQVSVPIAPRWLSHRVALRFETPAAAAPAGTLLAVSEPRVAVRGRGAAPLVALLSLDTVRADRLSAYGHGAPTSVRLDAWAARHATLFERVVAPAGSTLPSHTSMLSGLSVARHGVAANDWTVPADLALVQERMRSAGFRTLAVTGGGALHPSRGLARGFDRYRYWPRADGRQEVASGVETAQAWLDEHADEPVLLFFHTYEAHSPYHRRGHLPVPPECDVRTQALAATPRLRPALQWRPQRKGAGRPTFPCLAPLYDDGIAHLDQHLGPLLDRLAALAAVRPVTVVVTSDHGEALGEDGFVEHGRPLPGVMRVPLLVAGGGLAAGRRETRLVCGADVAPTLLAAAGLPTSSALDAVALGDPRERSCAFSGTDLLAPAFALERADGRGVRLMLGPAEAAPPPLIAGPDVVRSTAWPGEGDDRWPLVRALRDQVLAEAESRVLTVEAAEQPLTLTLRLEAGRLGLLGGEARLSRPARSPWRLEVPPHGRASVLLESPGGRLLLGHAGHGTAVDLGQRVEVELSPCPEGWCAAPGPGGPRVRLRWKGAVPARSENRELREQLKALGYVS